MPASDPRDNHKLFEGFWNEGDVDGLLDLYQADAVYVASATEQLAGHAQIRQMLEQMTALGIRNQLELVRLTEHRDIALERTRWTMHFPGEDGKTNAQSGSSTVVLRRQPDGGWRMIIDDPGLG